MSFLAATHPAAGQTTGLPPAISGGCSMIAAGEVTCTKTAGTAFAASVTVDATNAGNIATGNLPVTRIATALASPSVVGDDTNCHSVCTATDTIKRVGLAAF